MLIYKQINKKNFYILLFILLSLSEIWPEEIKLIKPVLIDQMVMMIIQIGVIIFAAKMGNIIFNKMLLPGFLGELTAGILLSPYMFGELPFFFFPTGLFPQQNQFPVSIELYGIVTLASIIILFMKGMETDVRNFLRFSMAGVWVGISSILFSFMIGDLLTVFFAQSIGHQSLSPFSPQAMFLGTISSATSVGIITRLLSNNRKMDSFEGVTIINGAVFAEILTIVMLSIALGISSFLKENSIITWMDIGMIGLKTMFLWLLVAVVTLLFSKTIGNLLKLFRSRTSMALMGLGLALMLAGFVEKIGLAMVIGAYIMGLSISKTDITHVIREKLHSIYDLLTPIFICVIGMLINFTGLLTQPVIIFTILYTLLAILAKIIGGSLPTLFFNFNLNGALRIGIGMLPRGEIALIIAGIGFTTGYISNQILGIAIVMTYITTLVSSPLLMLAFNQKTGLRKKLFPIEETSIKFEFPSTIIADFILDKLLELFETETFYVHLMDRDKNIYQLRKDITIIGLKMEDNKIIFDCKKEDEKLIYTAIYMVLEEIEQIIKELQIPLDKNEIIKKIQYPSLAIKKSFDLSTYILPEYIQPVLKGNTKAEVIEELINLAAKNRAVIDKDAARFAVWERENSMSTGMQHGIAIPHARTNAVNSLVCAIGIKKNGINFDSIDGNLANIIILTLSPINTKSPYAQFMSAISQVLNEENRKLLLTLTSNRDITTLFTGKLNNRNPIGDFLDKIDLRVNLNGNLKKYIHPECISLHLHGMNKKEIIEELLDMLVKKHKLKNPKKILEEIWKRENNFSTGLRNGIAIPHAKTDEVSDLLCAIGITEKGINFDSMDQEPAYIFILTLSPQDTPVPHIQFMSLLIRTLMSTDRDVFFSLFNTERELYNYLINQSFKKSL